MILLPPGGQAEIRAWTLLDGGRLTRRLLVFVLLVVPSAPAAGQQYVWSVPSSDVLNKGGILLETYAYLGPSHPRSLYLGPRLVAGVGGHVELGLNVSSNVQPTSDARVELAVKWKPWTSAGDRWDLVAGTHGYVPVYHRDYTFGSYSYAQLGRSFAGGARLSAGGYVYSAKVVDSSARGGAQIAYEQPLGRRLTLGADWVTGRHAAGYSTLGLYFEVTPKLYVSAGYAFGNAGVADGNHYLVLALSWEPK